MGTYKVNKVNTDSSQKNQQELSEFNIAEDFISLTIIQNGQTQVRLDRYDAPVEAVADYKGDTPKLILDPEHDVRFNGYAGEDCTVRYEFYKDLIKINNTPIPLYIYTISVSRTEIELKLIDKSVEKQAFTDKISAIEPVLKQYGFLHLRLDDIEKNPVITNIVIKEYSIFIKLSEPLQSSVGPGAKTYILELVSDSVMYELTYEESSEPTSNFIKGPNFEIEPVNLSVGTGTEQYTSLVKLREQFKKTSTPKINSNVRYQIDYSKFENFVVFSSAERLILNYRDKLIRKGANITMADLTPYEKYLFTKEQKNTTVKQRLERLNRLILQAREFDEINAERLQYNLPQFIYRDKNNKPLLDTIDLIGEMFDNINTGKVYIQNRFNSDHRAQNRLSVQLLQYAIEDFGIKITRNSSETLEQQQVSHEIYSRIYHNIPVLLKSKGTERGLRCILNCYGVPKKMLTFPQSQITVHDYRSRVFDMDSRVFVQSTMWSNVKESDTHTPIKLGFNKSAEVSKYLLTVLQDYVKTAGDPRYRNNTNVTKFKDMLFDKNNTPVLHTERYNQTLQKFNNNLFSLLFGFIPAGCEFDIGDIIRSDKHQVDKMYNPHVSYKKEEILQVTTTHTTSNVTGGVNFVNRKYYGDSQKPKKPKKIKINLNADEKFVDISYKTEEHYSENSGEMVVKHIERGHPRFTGELQLSRIKGILQKPTVPQYLFNFKNLSGKVNNSAVVGAYTAESCKLPMSITTLEKIILKLTYDHKDNTNRLLKRVLAPSVYTDLESKPDNLIETINVKTYDTIVPVRQLSKNPKRYKPGTQDVEYVFEVFTPGEYKIEFKDKKTSAATIRNNTGLQNFKADESLGSKAKLIFKNEDVTGPNSSSIFTVYNILKAWKNNRGYGIKFQLSVQNKFKIATTNTYTTLTVPDTPTVYGQYRPNKNQKGSFKFTEVKSPLGGKVKLKRDKDKYSNENLGFCIKIEETSDSSNSVVLVVDPQGRLVITKGDLYTKFDSTYKITYTLNVYEVIKKDVYSQTEHLHFPTHYKAQTGKWLPREIKLRSKSNPQGEPMDRDYRTGYTGSYTLLDYYTQYRIQREDIKYSKMSEHLTGLELTVKMKDEVANLNEDLNKLTLIGTLKISEKTNPIISGPGPNGYDTKTIGMDQFFHNFNTEVSNESDRTGLFLVITPQTQPSNPPYQKLVLIHKQYETHFKKYTYGNGKTHDSLTKKNTGKYRIQLICFVNDYNTQNFKINTDTFKISTPRSSDLFSFDTTSAQSSVPTHYNSKLTSLHVTITSSGISLQNPSITRVSYDTKDGKKEVQGYDVRFSNVSFSTVKKILTENTTITMEYQGS